MDYVAVSRKVMGRLLDMRMLRRKSAGVSDHFLVEGKLKVRMRWTRTRQAECIRQALKVSEFDKKRENDSELGKVGWCVECSGKTGQWRCRGRMGAV